MMCPCWKAVSTIRLVCYWVLPGQTRRCMILQVSRWTTTACCIYERDTMRPVWVFLQHSIRLKQLIDTRMYRATQSTALIQRAYLTGVLVKFNKEILSGKSRDKGHTQEVHQGKFWRL